MTAHTIGTTFIVAYLETDYVTRERPPPRSFSLRGTKHLRPILREVKTLQLGNYSFPLRVRPIDRAEIDLPREGGPLRGSVFRLNAVFKYKGENFLPAIAKVHYSWEHDGMGLVEFKQKSTREGGRSVLLKRLGEEKAEFFHV